MEQNEVSLIVVMLKDIKGTLKEHGHEISHIKDIKRDISDIKTEQKTFVKKPQPGTIKFWIKCGSFVSAVIIGVYHALTK